MLNDYVRRDLGFESDLPYNILTGLYQSWDFGAKNEVCECGGHATRCDDQKPISEGVGCERIL